MRIWKIVVKLHEMVLGVLAGFSERTPLPVGKAKRRRCDRKSLPGVDVVFGTFPLRGIGLRVLLQLPNSDRQRQAIRSLLGWSHLKEVS